MYHVDNSTGVPVMPLPSPITSETELFFTEGGNGVPPTYPGPDWFNAIQSELLNIIRAAGLDPDKMDNTQILAALKKLFLSRSNPFGDIKTDGAAAIATALSNLDLGEGSALPVGVPVPWPSATPPTGWLKCNGAPFSAAQYPKLALAYPSLALPDLRGEFIRGWDDGRGIDNGRALLSTQAALAGTITGNSNPMKATPNESGTPIMDWFVLNGVSFNDDPSTVVKTIIVTPGDTRPRNIAFNFIVRAA